MKLERPTRVRNDAFGERYTSLAVETAGPFNLTEQKARRWRQVLASARACREPASLCLYVCDDNALDERYPRMLARMYESAWMRDDFLDCIGYRVHAHIARTRVSEYLRTCRYCARVSASKPTPILPYRHWLRFRLDRYPRIRYNAMEEDHGSIGPSARRTRRTLEKLEFEFLRGLFEFRRASPSWIDRIPRGRRRSTTMEEWSTHSSVSSRYRVIAEEAHEELMLRKLREDEKFSRENLSSARTLGTPRLWESAMFPEPEETTRARYCITHAQRKLLRWAIRALDRKDSSFFA